MDYEKKYKEALERAKQFMTEHPTRAEQDLMTALFPELKESEDERIRKWIIEEFKLHYDFESKSLNPMVEKALAWLEKQKEQKPESDVRVRYKTRKECYLEGLEAGRKEQQPTKWSEDIIQKAIKAEPNDSIACLHIETFIKVARHFYELGLNAKKKNKHERD